MPVETGKEVREISVIWIPTGYSSASQIRAIVRDGMVVFVPPGLATCYIRDNPDGCIEFILAIKEAIKATEAP